MRTKTGTVSSTKMAKTVVVLVHTYKNHPKYKKRYRVTKKFYAHDEAQVCKEGDTVTVKETRPLSKLKRWTVLEVNGQPITA
jgi:small subunit ribosomal protein S17